MLNFDFLQKGLGLPSPPHFVYHFSRIIFLLLYSLNWPNSIVWLPLLLEMLGDMCIVIICCPVCDVINFEINHNFLTVFVRNQTFKTKMKISQEQKELLTWNKKHFSSFLKGFQLLEIVWDPRVSLYSI